METSAFIQRMIVLLLAGSVAALTAFAQQKPDDVIKVSTELVQSDFMVFDKQGNFVDGLKRDQLVFKVEGKMFALSALGSDPLEVSLKCEPDLADQLRDSYAAIRPGYHLNKRHWNTVTCDGSIPDPMIIDMLEDSYDLVVSAMSRKTRERLGWSPG